MDIKKKNILSSLLLLAGLVVGTWSKTAFSQQENLDEMYKDSFRKDIPRSMQEIPYEDRDYKKTFISPYALVSIPKKVRIDKDVLSPGYYLVKPFTENSVDYLIFKKNKIAVAIAAVASKASLKKKVKKIEFLLEETRHGKVYILTVKYKKESYTSKLDIIE